MNRKMNRTGKSAWIASPEPVRSAMKAPSIPKPAAISVASTRMHDDAGHARLDLDAEGERTHEVEDGLDEAHDGHACEVAGEERAAAHRRQRQTVEEAVLDVASEVRARVHRREERALDERHGDGEGQERVGRESRRAASTA